MTKQSSLPQETRLTASAGVIGWLRAHQASLAFTSAETGQLFLCGIHPNGSLSVNQQAYGRATGLYWQNGRLFLGTDRGLLRFANVSDPTTSAKDASDCVLVPRKMWLTGDVAIGEVAADASGSPVFVSARLVCLAEPDQQHACRPTWRPPARQAAWALTGIAMAQDRPAFVTAIAPADEGGGLIVGVADKEPVVAGLSRPHSPRVAADELFVVESGRGRLLAYDQATGAGRLVAHCPGFARGLALHDGFAVVALSSAHDSPELTTELAQRGETPWCGVAIIELASGALTEWIRLDGQIATLFDIAVLPGMRYPVCGRPF